VPFGNIRIAADGSLRVAAYCKHDKQRECHLLRSDDGGQTWGGPVMLNPRGNETDILHLGSGRWLASSRNNHEGSNVIIEQCTSVDDACTWRVVGPLTLAGQITSHLTRLADGRILLSYGNRNWGNYGVDVRFSDDEGGAWGPPIRIAACPMPDCGYPSTVELADGWAVTAYYTQLSHHYEYEMRVARWRPSDFLTKGRPA
jgi:hypothetical protein